MCIIYICFALNFVLDKEYCLCWASYNYKTFINVLELACDLLYQHSTMAMKMKGIYKSFKSISLMFGIIFTIFLVASKLIKLNYMIYQNFSQLYTNIVSSTHEITLYEFDRMIYKCKFRKFKYTPTKQIFGPLFAIMVYVIDPWEHSINYLKNKFYVQEQLLYDEIFQKKIILVNRFERKRFGNWAPNRSKTCGPYWLGGLLWQCSCLGKLSLYLNTLKIFLSYSLFYFSSLNYTFRSMLWIWNSKVYLNY